MEVKPMARVMRKAGVAARPLENGGVLLDLDTGAYFEVNPVGMAIWSAADGRSVGEIADVVRRQFEDAPVSLGEEVAAFVTALAERDLVVCRVS